MIFPGIAALSAVFMNISGGKVLDVLATVVIVVEVYQPQHFVNRCALVGNLNQSFIDQTAHSIGFVAANLLLKCTLTHAK